MRWTAPHEELWLNTPHRGSVMTKLWLLSCLGALLLALAGAQKASALQTDRHGSITLNGDDLPPTAYAARRGYGGARAYRGGYRSGYRAVSVRRGHYGGR